MLTEGRPLPVLRMCQPALADSFATLWDTAASGPIMQTQGLSCGPLLEARSKCRVHSLLSARSNQDSVSLGKRFNQGWPCRHADVSRCGKMLLKLAVSPREKLMARHPVHALPHQQPSPTSSKIMNLDRGDEVGEHAALDLRQNPRPYAAGCRHRCLPEHRLSKLLLLQWCAEQVCSNQNCSAVAGSVRLVLTSASIAHSNCLRRDIEPWSSTHQCRA